MKTPRERAVEIAQEICGDWIERAAQKERLARIAFEHITAAEAPLLAKIAAKEKLIETWFENSVTENERVAELEELLRVATEALLERIAVLEDERIGLYEQQGWLEESVEEKEELLRVATEALEFYADEDTYCAGDSEDYDISSWEIDCNGTKAREALERLRGKVGANE